GKAGSLSEFKGSKLLVVAFTNTTCPLAKKYAPTLQRLEKDFAAKGVSFLFVNPTATDTPDAKTFAGRQVHDKDGTLTAAFGATSTTEVIVLDAARTVQYRGAINDQYGLGYATDAPRSNYLATALNDLLAGKRPAIQATTAPGCELTPDPKKTPQIPLTYHARVERIVQANCVECHHKGGVGPFALDTYDTLVANKGMVRKVVDKGIMPPWFAAPPKKGEHSPFSNDRTLTESDKKDLLAWLAGDLKKGDEKDAPLPRTFVEGWGLGKPDAVFEMQKAIDVKAEGTMPYQNVVIPTNFDEDKWIQGLEVVPGARDVVHHVLVFAVPKGQTRAGNEAQGFFAAYVPGSTALVYPEGYAKKLPKGSNLVFQLHYTPNGKATADKTKLGLVFAKDKPRFEVQVVGLFNPAFTIPPGADNHRVGSFIYDVPADAHILALFPHAHLRGKAAQYRVIKGDEKKTVLDVPHYDFNWQLQYRFAEPVAVKAGDALSYLAWYDNSTKNPANPDPKQSVRWGLQTYEEMHLGYVEFAAPLGTNMMPATLNLKMPANFKFPKEPVEIPDVIKGRFKGMDANGDGKLDEKEYNALPDLIKPIVARYIQTLEP
ncbi:MAG: redoxin family protein, partial [Gemmataceae bacterium]|nr:redoxin family protein [Gemmataceae bacterium]